MEAIKRIEIKSAVGIRTAFLSPKADALKECYSDIRLNGESTLEFMLPSTSKKIEYLTPECQIWANGKVYTLLKDDAVDTVRDEKNALWTKFMAIERWAELDMDFIEPSLSNDPTTPIPSDLAVIIVSGGSNLSGGLYTTGSAAHALYAVLDDSEWSIGTVDVTGIHDLEAEKASRLQLIKMVQEIWGGYLIWDSVNKIVHLRDANTWQNYTGFQIRYKKNLKHITRTQSNKLVTKMYVFGHDELDIASVNDGIKYLTDLSYTTREYTGIYKNQDIYDAQELKDKAIEELSLICRPRYLYKVKMVDLRTLPEYSHEDFVLGDMADVIDPDIANEQIRIIRHKYNLFRPWECEIDLGDPEERLVESLKASFNTTGFIDGVFNGNGKISGASIEDLTITNSSIADLTITNSKIGNLTITGSKIANATITNAKISDLSADKITAGTISATISIISPLITGGTITGALVRTAASGSRIELSDFGGSGGLIKLFDSSNVQTGALFGGNNMLFITSTRCQLNASDSLSITSAGDISIYPGSSDSVNPYGTWDCSSARFLKLKDGSGYDYVTNNWVNSQDFVKAGGSQTLRIQIYSGNLEVLYDGDTYVFTPS